MQRKKKDGRLALRMYYVYILHCADDTYYVGSTNDITKRLHAHNHLKSGAHYTKIRRPVSLAYLQTCDTYGKARAREAELKRLNRSQKTMLVESFREQSLAHLPSK
jgi:putative endonuclease